jgi:Cu+-exporting ATPase
MNQLIASSKQNSLDEASCRHCGNNLAADQDEFCCSGCHAVYNILHSNNLLRYYNLAEKPGIKPSNEPARYEFLNDQEIKRTVLDYELEGSSGVTLTIPSIHCSACVWLLENLYKMHPAIGRSEVQLAKRRARIQFDPGKISLSELALFLDKLGYPPVFSLKDTDRNSQDESAGSRKLIQRLAVAGFCFGNIMLFSFPFYLGLDPAHSIQAWSFSLLSILLSIPVLVYAADIFWRAAYKSVRAGVLGIDIPITLGISALFLASLADIFLSQGEGYLDSLSGLVFLLLCGRVFQQKTFQRMVFDRDYRSYFPIAVRKLDGAGDRSVSLPSLRKGDRIRIRCGELIPADSILEEAEAVIDYSFITGESEPQRLMQDRLLYAGGRVCGSAIVARVEKEVDQGYLTGLWNQGSDLHAHRSGLSLTNRVSPWFTAGIILISSLAALTWAILAPAKAPFVFAAVLIVACPCALALSAPFVYGQAVRMLGARGIYLRNTDVIERLAGIRAILFDKTGTLTSGYQADFIPVVDTAESYLALVQDAAAQSAHPYCRAISAMSTRHQETRFLVWQEKVGKGIEAETDRHRLFMGSPAWLIQNGVTVQDNGLSDQSRVAVAVNGQHIGDYHIRASFRHSLAPLMTRLATRFKLGLVSGDRQASRDSLNDLAGCFEGCWMEQAPADKADRVEAWRLAGTPVMMVGDGLNDSAALLKSDVGVVISDDTALFCPASDVVLQSDQLTALPGILSFARRAVAITVACIVLSLLYNVIGISIAVSGHLSPLIAAILMPLSSFTVIAVALGATTLAGKALLKEAP